MNGHEHHAEGLAVEGPQLPGGLGHDGRRARAVVHERELAERAARVDLVAHVL